MADILCTDGVEPSPEDIQTVEEFRAFMGAVSAAGYRDLHVSPLFDADLSTRFPGYVERDRVFVVDGALRMTPA